MDPRTRPILSAMPPLYQKLKTYGGLIVLLFSAVTMVGCQSAQPVKVEKTAPGKPVGLVSVSATPQSHRDLEFAIEQFKSNQYEVAEYYLKRSLIQSPDNPLSLRFLPWAYFFQKRYDKALISFEKARTRFPHDPEPLIGMGWSYLAMKFYERAYDKFKQAQTLSKNSYEVFKGLGFSHLFLAREKSAQYFFKKIYTFAERDDLEDLWEKWAASDPEKGAEVAPSKIDTVSLFTLNIEAPRYRSMLSVYPGYQPGYYPALEDAWRLYRKKLYDRALVAFQSLPEPIAHTLDARNGLAWSLLQEGYLSEANQVFKNSMDVHGAFIGTRLGIREAGHRLMKKAATAKHYFDIHKNLIAEKHLTQLNMSHPEWSYPYSLLGWIGLRRGQEDIAQTHFETALVKNPRDAAALQGMRHLSGVLVSKLYQADLKLKRKDYKQASYLYFSYVDRHPQDAPVTFLLAKAYSGLGFSQIGKKQYTLALQNFQKIQDRKEFRAHWNKGLGMAYYYLGQYDEAARHLIVADAMFPNQKDIIYKLDWSILLSWDPETARDYFLEKAQRKPLRASVYMSIGWIEYLKGDPDLGVEYFLKAISLDPDIADSEDFYAVLNKERFGWQVYNHIGWAYYHRNDFENSMKMFRIALKGKPRSSEAMKGLGYNFYRLKQWQEASTLLQKSIKRNPSTPPVVEQRPGIEPGSVIPLETSARTQLARSLYQEKKYKEALEQLLLEKNNHPDWNEVYDGLGWVYLKLGRLTQAREAFTQALKHQPMNPRSHQGLKEVQYRLALQRL